MNDLNLVNKDHCNDIQFYGIKRSGNHAIISWILGHFENSIHYNDCTVDKNSNIFYKTCEEPQTPQSNNFRKLVSFEDNLQSNNSTIKYIGDLLPSSKLRIIIIRDPYNTYASRIKLSEKLKIKSISWCNPEIWIDIAKEFLGITNYLNASLKINYNMWFKNKNYRKELSKNFGLFTDKNINLVYPDKIGSSFDDFKYNTEASKMSVIHRWKTMINTHAFKEIFKNKELISLNNMLFGNILKI